MEQCELIDAQRALIEQQAKEIKFHTGRVEALRRFLSEKITECQKQAKEIARLRDSERKLTALEAAGVDNWEGYSDAMQMMEEKEHP